MDALYQTNQYCSPIEINLHSVDCKQSKNWVIGSWGTTIFFDQFKVPAIKFGKCFEEFMIPIALLKKFGS